MTGSLCLNMYWFNIIQKANLKYTYSLICSVFGLSSLHLRPTVYCFLSVQQNLIEDVTPQSTLRRVATVNLNELWPWAQVRRLNKQIPQEESSSKRTDFLVCVVQERSRITFEMSTSVTKLHPNYWFTLKALKVQKSPHSVLIITVWHHIQNFNLKEIKNKGKNKLSPLN